MKIYPHQSHAAAQRAVGSGLGPVPFTRAGTVAPLIGFLNDLGAPVPRLLQRARIAPDQFDAAEEPVPLYLVHRLVEIAADTQGIDNLGVLIGQQTSAYELGAFGRQLRQSLSVYDYLHTGIRLIGSVTSQERFWLTFEGENVRFHHFVPGNRGRGHCHADLFALAATIRMLRQFAGTEWAPREVRLMTRDERLLGDAAVFGDAKIHLGEANSSFTFQRSLLQRVVPNEVRNAGAPSLIGPAGPALPGDFLDSIELLIGSLLTRNRLDIDLVAEAAGLSRRTLQRRLQARGASYAGLVERTRLRLAADWLARTLMPIGEIAALLGYRDGGNFSRAFRRRTGMTPQQYRRQA